MADHAIALATPLGGPHPDESGLVAEDVAVTGTGGTTGTYTTQMKQPQRVIGSFFTVTFSGQVGTFASAAFTGVKYVRILGYAA